VFHGFEGVAPRGGPPVRLLRGAPEHIVHHDHAHTVQVPVTVSGGEGHGVQIRGNVATVAQSAPERSLGPHETPQASFAVRSSRAVPIAQVLEVRLTSLLAAHTHAQWRASTDLAVV